MEHFYMEELPDNFKESIRLIDLIWNVSESEIDQVVQDLKENLTKSSLIINDIILMIDKKLSFYSKNFMPLKDLYFRILEDFKIEDITKILPNKLYFEPEELKSIEYPFEPSSLEDIIFRDDLQSLISATDLQGFNFNQHLGRTLLIDFAASKGSVECFKFIFLNQAAVWESTLEKSFEGGNLEIINICEQKIQITPGCMDQAIMHHQDELVRYLVDKYQLSWTWISTMFNYNYKLFFEKLAMCEDIYETDIHGDNCMFAASFHLQLELMKFLINKGYDADNSKLMSKAPPIIYAICEKRIDIVKYLLDHGAEAENKNTVLTNLTSAIYINDFDLTKLLIEHSADINRLNAEGSTPLNAAIEYSSIDVVELLLSNGADSNVSDLKWNSPLDCAIHKNNLDIIKLLIKYGANVNSTHIEHAIQEGNDEIINFLRPPPPEEIVENNEN